MKGRVINIVIILAILAAAIFVVYPKGDSIKIGNRPLKPVLGLDLRGGMQVILSVPESVALTRENLQGAASILETRSNALGVSEVVYQTAGDRIIVGEYPGATDADEIINKVKQVGQLEFVDFGTEPLAPGTEVKTDFGMTAGSTSPTTVPTEAPTGSPTQQAGASTTPAATTPPPAEKVYHTVLTGSDLVQNKILVEFDPNTREPVVAFELKPEAGKIFSDYTGANIGKILGIVLDKKVVSSPSINSQIPDGKGIITGNFTVETANTLATQLRYGALPIPLEIEQIRVVGPSLGEDSLRKSEIAGLIGFAIIMLFMALFYKLPGVVADLALIFYALTTFAIFILVPVTLTLPGIAGFMLSTGSALDANILIFERFKEELRAGRTVAQAFQLGCSRAWPSIRDSNISALITSGILWWFGSTFGASFVKGFALTLAFGVITSVLTAFFVTRPVLGLIIDKMKDPEKKLHLFGL